MYFRFAGGKIFNKVRGEFTPCDMMLFTILLLQFGEVVYYPSYIKTACLPGNYEGKRLYGMIEMAAKSKKLFVVAQKYNEFKLRSKVRLLNRYLSVVAYLARSKI